MKKVYFWNPDGTFLAIADWASKQVEDLLNRSPAGTYAWDVSDPVHKWHMNYTLSSGALSWNTVEESKVPLIILAQSLLMG